MVHREISELDRNHAVFEAELEEGLKEAHSGKSVLMHDGQVVEIFDNDREAHRVGYRDFGDGGFSVHIVDQQPLRLGAVAMFL